MTATVNLPHQALPSPDVPPAGYAFADVSGDNPSADPFPAQMGLSVPAHIAGYVGREKQAARDAVAQHTVLQGLRNIGPQFEGAVKASAETLATLKADRDEAIRFAPESRTAIDALQAPKVNKARAERKEAIATWASTFDAQLAASEREAAAKVADLPNRVSPAAQDWSRRFFYMFDNLTPRHATDAVTKLAGDVAAGRMQADNARALLPMLMSRVETDKGWDSAEMRQAVQVLEVAARDRHWHQAHQTLVAVRGARERLRLFAEMWQERAGAFLPNGLFADFYPNA